MKASELRSKDEKELQALLLELTRERFNLRMQQGSGQLARPDALRKVGRNIARVKTILTEKRIGRSAA